MTDEHYWPGSMTWDEIVALVRALPERIEPEDVATVATIAGILGVFGFPEGSKFGKKPTREEGC